MSVPVDVGREEARRLAERELGKTIYEQFELTAFEKAWDWLMRWLNTWRLPATDASAGGWFWLIVIAFLVVLVVALVRYRAGAVQRARRRTAMTLLDVTTATTAAEERLAAGQHSEAGEWAKAIRARMRAIALGLEERALLDRRPGRTADEVAREGSAGLPGHEDELREAARIFDDVWYGDHEATREAYDRITRVDDRIKQAKPSLSGVSA